MILTRSFYDRDPRLVAPDLLGKYLVRRLDDGTILKGEIIEVEAYVGEGDPAAHTFKGKTTRNASVYMEGGHAYVHTQRHHTLLDIVTLGLNVPGSVLIRGLIPKEGIERMKQLRETDSIPNLTNGPGKICQAFGIGKRIEKSGLWIEDHKNFITAEEIMKTTRIGISKGKEDLLRFVVTRS
jgi:DNA-3-methyladenine glycosylase